MFLKEVIHDIINTKQSWENMVLILPSNRSIREFKSLLAKEISAPIFSPSFLTIEEFISEVSGLSLCDSLDLHIRLHTLYLKNHSENPEDYVSFEGWVNNVLNDFNEIDRHLIPPDDIFNYLTAISSIKNWNPNKEPTPLQSKYTKFINSLAKLYKDLNHVLYEDNLGYQGMLYKHAFNNIDSYLQKHESSTYKVIGLNALNKVEKSILNKVLEFPMSKVYWDLDSHFVSDTQHSAGLFMRQNLSDYQQHVKKQLRFSDNTFLTRKSIKINGVPKSMSQAKYVGGLLQTINFSNGPVALVLADESLLSAILNSIPEIDSNVNVTMGYPLKKTQTYKFLKCAFELKPAETESGYYYKDLLQLLNSPILSCFIASKEITSFEQKLKQKNDSYITKNSLQEFLKKNLLLLKITSTQKTAVHILEDFVTLFMFLIENKKLEKNKIEVESCHLLITTLKEFYERLSGIDYDFTFKELKVLIDSQIDSKTISFNGNPSEGLQIMGLLETRTLDFETIIMTSLNEEILPAGKSYNSFIPYDIKREFGLPTIKEKDAVYSYHFYRLLQRAKNVHLIYNTEPDVLKGGEPSRFINQLITDENLKGYVEHNFSSATIASNKSVEKRTEKTDLLIKQLRSLASSGLSPSSLSSYIRNPYEFYKQYVLGVNSADSVEEDIAYNVLGSIIHDSLEKLYMPLVGETLNPNLFNTIEAQIAPIVSAEFENYYPKNALLQGKNYILLQVVKKYITSVIAYDRKACANKQLKIVALEQKLKATFKLKDGPEVLLKGKIDRVDIFDGQLRIIDYKTGVVETSGLNLKGFDDLFTNKKYDKAFQLLCYTLLYSIQEGKLTGQAAILPIKQMNKGLLPLRVDKSAALSLGLIQQFKNGLISLIEEILNPNFPFVEKDD